MCYTYVIAFGNILNVEAYQSLFFAETYCKFNSEHCLLQHIFKGYIPSAASFIHVEYANSLSNGCIQSVTFVISNVKDPFLKTA